MVRGGKDAGERSSVSLESSTVGIFKTNFVSWNKADELPFRMRIESEIDDRICGC